MGSEAGTPARRPLVGRADEFAISRALLDAGGDDVLLVSGDAGVGKTHLVEALADYAEERGWAVVRVAATPSTQRLSLAPFAHLDRSSTPAPDAGARLARVLNALRTAAGSRPLLLTVDDAPYIDEGSIVLIHQLMAQGDAKVALTARDTAQVAEGLLRPSSAAVLSLVLGPLARSASDELVDSTLGGRTEGATRDSVWELAAGNPLFIRELTRASAADGSLRVERGVWQLRGALSVSPALRDQIGLRLGQADPAEMNVLRALAVADHLTTRQCLAIGPPELLRALEIEGFIVAVAQMDGARLVAPSHPLFAEVIRATTPALTLDEARRTAAAALLTEPRPGDLVRAAELHVDAGDQPVDLLTRAAWTALEMYTPEAALPLVQSALDEAPTWERKLLEARTLSALGRDDDAQASMDLLARTASDPEQVADVTIVHAGHLVWRLGDLDGAVALLQARQITLPPAGATRVASFLAYTQFFTGQFEAALTTSEPHLDDNPSLETMAGALSASAVLGRPARVFELWDGYWDRAGAREDEPSKSATDWLLLANTIFIWLLALWQTGQAPQGDDPVATMRTLVRVPNLETEEHELGLGLCQELFRGHIERALTMVEKVGDRLFGVARQVGLFNEIVAALAYAHAGDAARAQVRLESVRDDPLTGAGPYPFWFGRAEAWCWAAAGQVDRAVDYLLALAETHSAEGFHLTIGLEDVVRLGAAERAVVGLEARAAHPEATWWDQICAEHARAVVDADPARLLVVADRFETGGLDLHAAEATAQAVRLLELPVASVARADALVRLGARLERCGRAVTPALADRPPVLTRREYEVAGLAAAGLSNRDISAQLGSSERTVGNQLQHVFEKLGLHGRGELADAIRTRLE